MTVAAARLAEIAHKRALNARTGVSELIPPADIFTAATAAPEPAPES